MGRKTLQLKNYSSAQIKEYFKTEEKYTIGIRLYAVYQVSKGVSTRKLEELYNTSFKQIANWVHQFDNEGIDGLKNKPKSGRISKLNEKQKQRIKKLVLKESPEKYGYETATWTGPLLIDWIKKNYSIEYKKAQIYNIMKKMNLTFQKGKGIYPEADKVQQKEFVRDIKKTSKSKEE